MGRRQTYKSPSADLDSLLQSKSHGELTRKVLAGFAKEPKTPKAGPQRRLSEREGGAIAANKTLARRRKSSFWRKLALGRF